MRKNRNGKSLLGLCLAGILAISMPAYGGQITITPLDSGTEAGTAAAQGPAAETSSAAAPTEHTGDAGAAVQVAEPSVASQGAALLDASTGALLYGKNAETSYYPASITKLMTALLVAESCGLEDTVTFSAAATTNLESGAVSIGMTEGDTMTVRQCLYALLLKSANEVGNALAEHVAGSNAAFADRMNAKAASLGCTNTHFTNPHGLNDVNHYTTPHDMALIARAAFQNETVRTVAGTLSYTLPATKNHPSGLTISIGHKMLYPSDSRYYSGIIGGKTGYTSKAGNTLVTEAQRDGVTLVAVVMKSSSTHYTDTKALLDYGFALAKAGRLAGETTQREPAGAAQGTSGETEASSSQGPGAAVQTGWVQNGDAWSYIKANGLRASNELITADGTAYWFDSDAVMAKGWRQIDGQWRYFRSDGSMAVNYWTKRDAAGKTYYLDANGVMLTNTTTPDGYRVGADGAWIPS